MDEKQYLPNYILKFKSKVKPTNEILQLFEEIKQNMPIPNYKIKNRFIKGNNKWFCKKFTNDSEKVKKNINGFLNKFTDKNYLEITNKILKLKIDDIELLTYLASTLIEKIITETYYIDYWSYLLDKLIFNNKKWNFEQCTFTYIMYAKIQEYFENLIVEDYDRKMLKLKDTNIKEYYTEKKRNVGFAFIFSKLYKLNLINDKILDNCLEELLHNRDNIYHMNVAIHIIQKLNSFFDDKHLEFYTNILKSYMNDSNINKKIKFMIMDYFDDNNFNNNNRKNTSLVDKNINIDIKIKSYIDEYIENMNYKDIIYYLNELKNYFNKSEIVYEFFKQTINKSKYHKDIIANLVNKLLNNGIFNNVHIGEFLELLFKEYDDLILDYPNINDTLKIFLIKFKNNGYDKAINMNLTRKLGKVQLQKLLI